METPVLKDPQVLPTNDVLNCALGSSYPAFVDLMEVITHAEYGLVPEWHYYNDGKAWLCKVCYKKKTVFWLSVWDQYFKAGFYFTEKNCSGIADLEISEQIKDDFAACRPIGKLLPLVINVTNTGQIEDVIKVVAYKKSLK